MIDKLATSSQSGVKSVIEEILLKRSTIKSEFKFEDVNVNLDDDMITAEIEIEMSRNDSSVFEPLDGLFIEDKPYEMALNYSDPLTQRFRNEMLISAKAGGYTPSFTYAKSLSAAFRNLHYNVTASKVSEI
jgi:hypothetical protein